MKIDGQYGLKWVAALGVVVALASCGGGSDGALSTEEASPISDAASPSDIKTNGSQPPSTHAILNEWELYPDPDAPQSVPTAPDPVEVILGRGARINSESLKAAKQKAGTTRQSRKALVYTGLVPVYRFFNTSTAAHFYTVSEVERDRVIADLPNFQYEGAAFEVSPTEQAGLSAVYRFFNTRTGVHFYTISEDERSLIQSSLPDFQYEGIAYYASKVPGDGLAPMFRFYRRDRGLHFYTASHVERDNVISTGCAYRYEGTGYYVFSATAEPNPPEARPNAVVLVVGDSLAKGYGISIGGNAYNFVSKGKVWTERLSTELRTRTNRVCNQLVNVSIGGMRTVEGANGIQGWVDQYAPTHLILAQGTNDAWQNRGVASMIANLTKMAEVGKAAGSHVYVMEFTFYPKGAAYRQGMTNMYQGVASDTQTAYFNGTGNVPLSSTYYHSDSVHLKDAAQPAVLENVWAALQPTL